MTWQELGALGELTGAVAAVALLGYIAYQIRQNSRLLDQNARATRAATLQAGTEFHGRAWALVAQDPALAAIWRRVRDGEAVDRDETVRFEALLTVFMAHVEHAYLQREMGWYHADILAVGGSVIADLLSPDPTRRWWQRAGHRSFRPEFSEAINRLLEVS